MSGHAHHTAPNEPDDGERFWRSRTGIAFTVLAAVAALYLLFEHWLHVLGVVPWLLLLLCPLMHFFMHGGHGRRGGDKGGAGDA